MESPQELIIGTSLRGQHYSTQFQVDLTSGALGRAVCPGGLSIIIIK